jgi:hypothetical protein
MLKAEQAFLLRYVAHPNREIGMGMVTSDVVTFGVCTVCSVKLVR